MHLRGLMMVWQRVDRTFTWVLEVIWWGFGWVYVILRALFVRVSVPFLCWHWSSHNMMTWPCTMFIVLRWRGSFHLGSFSSAGVTRSGYCTTWSTLSWFFRAIIGSWLFPWALSSLLKPLSTWPGPSSCPVRISWGFGLGFGLLISRLVCLMILIGCCWSGAAFRGWCSLVGGWYGYLVWYAVG